MSRVKDDIKPVVQEFRNALEKIYKDRLVKVIIYGSTARGEAGPGSDLDMVLVIKGLNAPSKEIDRLADILASINLRYGILISVLPIDSGYYESASGPFWRNVHKEGIAA